MRTLLFFMSFVLASVPALAASSGGEAVNVSAGVLGLAALGVFVVAYLFVIAEEVLHLRKSKPVMLAAGVIWVLVAIAYGRAEQAAAATSLLRHNLLEFAELLLFLLSAMTFINVLQERGLFASLRDRLIATGFTLRGLFWLTGGFAFFLSPVADNLTTALVMGAVVLAVGQGFPLFISAACVNIVVAANAGGAFSPFGDITTLMVWQKGLVSFTEFFALFVPALVSWLVPATIMHFFIPAVKPQAASGKTHVRQGGYGIALLFLATIVFTVCSFQFLALPPFMGMMAGLGCLSLYAYYLQRREKYDLFEHIKNVEWDTLLFFYGVILCVGGLAAFGYLAQLSGWLYGELGPTATNVLVGILSAVIDNIPVMFAVLTMSPEMGLPQWLLVTLTAGIGGSMLSIGSAAGVALMGQARGEYTFFSHLKWTGAIALGYAIAIILHIWMNGV